jgi:hypothetical protein
MRCLADFVLASDLCLKLKQAPLVLADPSNDFVLTITNASGEQANLGAVLSAQLVFDVQSFDNIRDLAFDKLTIALNALAFATNRKFALKRLLRVIDWTAGISERSAIIYDEVPEWSTVEPGLDEEFIETATRLLAMQAGEKQQRALRWYRLGLQAENIEEQFSYLWFALEIVSEAMKGSEKIESRCPKCRGPLFCEKCGVHPMHRRYAGEAIKQMVERVHPENSNEVFETFQTIRHTLMHGDRISSVITSLPCDEQQAINKLAFVTWHSLGLMFFKADTQPEIPMTFGYVENFVRRTVVAEANIVVGALRGDPLNPQLSDFPEVKFDLVVGKEG